jgi:seryl-tRNA synthetase
MPEPTPNGAGGTQAAQPLVTVQPDAQKTFTQEELTRIVRREIEEERKKNKPLLDKAEQYDALQKQIQEKQQAEMSELERVKSEKAELEPFKGQAESYANTIKELIAEEISAIPDENKSIIPEGMPDIQLYKWLVKNRKLTGGPPQTLAAPSGGRIASHQADPARLEAETKYNHYYGHLKNDPMKESRIKSFEDSLRQRKAPQT